MIELLYIIFGMVYTFVAVLAFVFFYGISRGRTLYALTLAVLWPLVLAQILYDSFKDRQRRNP